MEVSSVLKPAADHSLAAATVVLFAAEAFVTSVTFEVYDGLRHSHVKGFLFILSVWAT